MISNFNSAFKKDYSSISISKIGENLYLFIFIYLPFFSFGVCIYVQYFFDVVNKQKRSTIVRSKEDQKFMERICHMNVTKFIWPSLLRVIVALNFSVTSFKLKRDILPTFLNNITIITWRQLVYQTKTFLRIITSRE